VEDNLINTKVALQYLKRMGYTADHAKDGVEALELCDRAALADSMYDIILLDIQMPNMDVPPLYYAADQRAMKRRGFYDKGTLMMCVLQ
jgi:CheY-like chemotaxis protein